MLFLRVAPEMKLIRMRTVLVLSTLSLAAAGALGADTCTTQSAMQAADRDSIVAAATSMAQKVAQNDAAALKSVSIPLVAGNFAGITATVADAAPNLRGASFTVQSVWLLDSPSTGAEAASDAQFFCDLNKGAASVSFLIPALPHGRYALAVMQSAGTQAPWQVSVLMQAGAAGQWQLAGLYPHPATAAGHDGVWFWRQARDFAAKKESWNAWVYFGEAHQLLRPVPFLTSSHLDSLEEEWRRSAPPALSAGIRPDAPLVIRSRQGTEFRVTGLSADSSLANSKVDLAMHVAAEPAADPAAARARNLQAAAALIGAYPELRQAFHGVWIFAEAAGGTSFASEEPMERITP